MEDMGTGLFPSYRPADLGSCRYGLRPVLVRTEIKKCRHEETKARYLSNSKCGRRRLEKKIL